jgi:hypothetical protein
MIVERPQRVAPAKQRWKRYEESDCQHNEDGGNDIEAPGQSRRPKVARGNACVEQRLAFWRGNHECPGLTGTCGIVCAYQHRHDCRHLQDALSRLPDASRCRQHPLGSDDANSVTAGRIEHRLDVDKAQAECSRVDEIGLRLADPFDGDLRGRAAPGERPRAAGAIGSDGKDSGRPAKQRLVGAIEEGSGSCRIRGRGVELRGLARDRRRDVAERCNHAGHLSAHGLLDQVEGLGLGRAEPQTLDRDADGGRQGRAHEACEADTTERPLKGWCAHGAGGEPARAST